MKGMADAIVAKITPEVEDEGDKTVMKAAKLEAARRLIEGVIKQEPERVAQAFKDMYTVCGMLGEEDDSEEYDTGSMAEFGAEPRKGM